MKLHIFNPDHDLALASNKSSYVAPHAARELRHDLAFIPSLWADEGDYVLVDDVDAANECARHLAKRVHKVKYVTFADLRNIQPSADFEISPWGWDKAICHQLEKANHELADFMPSADQLSEIRQLSSRKFAAENVLPRLVELDQMIVGESYFYNGSTDELAERLSASSQDHVLKSPWSSSGRGVKFVQSNNVEHSLGWISNIISAQGGVMVEPYFNKIKDFGMEFVADEKGVRYCGLSLFQTSRSAYTGNLLATEEVKFKILKRYVNIELLTKVRSSLEEILTKELQGKYVGPLGVDMMIIALSDGSVALHPCVEINLRRTMGHVALALSPSPFEPRQLMHIDHTDKFHFRLTPLMDDLLNTSVVRL